MDINNNHNLRNPKRPNHGGGREDCWSDGATETLIEAWGDRYLRLNRGNLRQNDWKEVADAVNAGRTGVKPLRTDVQCKNRIDTLKKKYKVEKAKSSTSNWSFYSRLNHLIGSNAGSSSKRKSVRSQRRSVVKFNVKSKLRPNPNPNPNTNAVVVYSANSSSNSEASSSNESSLGGGGGGGGRDDDALFRGVDGGLRKNRIDSVSLSEVDAYKELARAVVKFGEIYERIESSKQQQLMELEKQRMEFIKDLEFQRMNMFMEAQVHVEKMNRPAKGAPSTGKKS